MKANEICYHLVNNLFFYTIYSSFHTSLEYCETRQIVWVWVFKLILQNKEDGREVGNKSRSHSPCAHFATTFWKTGNAPTSPHTFFIIDVSYVRTEILTLFVYFNESLPLSVSTKILQRTRITENFHREHDNGKTSLRTRLSAKFD